MDIARKEALEQAGIDTADALQRFMGNEVLYERLLAMFPGQSGYPELMAAWEKKDYENVFQSAHILKGVAGNLGMGALMKKAGVVVEKLRFNYCYVEGIENDISEVSKSYQVVMKVINKMQ